MYLASVREKWQHSFKINGPLDLQVLSKKPASWSRKVGSEGKSGRDGSDRVPGEKVEVV